MYQRFEGIFSYTKKKKTLFNEKRIIFVLGKKISSSTSCACLKFFYWWFVQIIVERWQMQVVTRIMNILCISMYTLVIGYIITNLGYIICNLGFLYSWTPPLYKKDNCFLDCKVFYFKSLMLVLHICSVPPLPRNMSLIQQPILLQCFKSEMGSLTIILAKCNFTISEIIDV
jgi:hypothetical protein